MIFHVEINQKSFEVEADTTADAISFALTQYEANLTDEPAQCLEEAPTQPLCVCARPVGSLVTDPNA